MNSGQMGEAIAAIEDEGTDREPHVRVFAHAAADGFAYFDVDGTGRMVVSEELMTVILLAAGFVEVDVPE